MHGDGIWMEGKLSAHLVLPMSTAGNLACHAEV